MMHGQKNIKLLYKRFEVGTSGVQTSKCLCCKIIFNMYILNNQRDATYTVFFIVISALHVSGGFSAHHQELTKLYVQPWVLSCFPAFYRWCGWVNPNHTNGRQQESMKIPKAAYTVL